MKKYVSLFGIILAGILVIGAGCVTQSTPSEELVPQPAETGDIVSNDGEAQAGTITVQLETSGTDTTYDQSIAVDSEATVQEVMETAAKANDFEYTTQTAEGLGEYVDSVGGVVASGETGYWLYYINDAAALEGIATQTVQDGDAIEWRLEPAF